jgi:hypothetical protein
MGEEVASVGGGVEVKGATIRYTSTGGFIADNALIGNMHRTQT